MITAFRFRIRCQLEPGRSIQELEGEACFALDGVGRCEIKPAGVATTHEGQTLVIKGPTVPSIDEARRLGERTLGALLSATLHRGYAVLLQPRRPPGYLTDYGMTWAHTVFPGNDLLYRESLGLTVYEETGKTGFISLPDLRTQVGSLAGPFIDEWNSVPATRLSTRKLIAYELYANSRFEAATSTRFLLLVMAVEALATQIDRPQFERDMLDRFIADVASSKLGDERKEMLADGLRMLRRESIGAACSRLLHSAVHSGAVSDTDAGRFFRRCYRTRGTIVHSGRTPAPSELTTMSNQLEPIVRGLLRTSLAPAEGDDPEQLWVSEYARTLTTQDGFQG